ncbi:MAG TPA: glycosyltransferase family 1 protein [Anaerolineae bacterium]|nr:glycosyltransferase family 1 protein [Anaerolineae bacterium]
MKRILVDGMNLAQEMKGVGWYTANVLREWSCLDTDRQYKILVRTGEILPDVPRDERFEYIPISLRNHYWHGGRVLPHYAHALGANTAWIPYETMVGRMPCPFTLVCHDVPQLLFESQRAGGEQFGLVRDWMNRVDDVFTQQSLRRAAMIFANSHFVQAWLRNELSIPSERIGYAPCAPSADFAALSQKVDCDAVRCALNSSDGYVLVFATGDRRENLDTVLRVFDAVVASNSTIHLVIAGIREKDAANIHAQVARWAWKERVRFVPFLRQNEMLILAGLYAAARAYLDLSLHEGFGMQVIEAMACGTPVVCSNRSALPEVSGGAAQLVEPSDMVGVTAALEQVLANMDCAAQLRVAGRARAASYSWARTAKTILDAFEGI